MADVVEGTEGVGAFCAPGQIRLEAVQERAQRAGCALQNVDRESEIELHYRPGGLGGSGSRGIRAGSQGSGGRGFGGSGSLTGPGSFLSGGNPIITPFCRLAAQFGQSRSNQFLDEPHGYWFRDRQPDRALRHLVLFQVPSQLPPDRASHRIQTAMVLEGRVPDEWANIEREGGNPITERFCSARRDGANGGPNLLEGCACLGGLC